MIELLKNPNNLKDEDINELVLRVKILLINSQKEVILGYSHNTYQFIGGHVEENEDIIDSLKREICEETGIQLDIERDLKPFAILNNYAKDWPKKGTNRNARILYYMLECNKEIDLSNVNYTDHEKDGNFELRYVKMDSVIDELIDNYKKHPEAEGIAKEMINLINKCKEKNLWNIK